MKQYISHGERTLISISALSGAIGSLLLIEAYNNMTIQDGLVRLFVASILVFFFVYAFTWALEWGLKTISNLTDWVKGAIKSVFRR